MLSKHLAAACPESLTRIHLARPNTNSKLQVFGSLGMPKLTALPPRAGQLSPQVWCVEEEQQSQKGEAKGQPQGQGLP